MRDYVMKMLHSAERTS